jgi:hypothetical protein
MEEGRMTERELREREASFLAAIARLEVVHEAYLRKLEPFDAKRREGLRLTGQEDGAERDLRRTLRQLDEGVEPSEGVDRELWVALSSLEVKRLGFRTPGLAPLRRLLARVQADLQRRAAEAAEDAAQPWPRPFRLRPGYRYVVTAGRELRPGEVVLLSKSSYAACSDRFDPAGPEDAEQVNAPGAAVGV